MKKSETLVSNRKALAILAECDALDSYVEGQSYYIVVDEGGDESLVGYGDVDEAVATNNTTTSWHSPGCPALPEIGENDWEWVSEELDRIEVECTPIDDDDDGECEVVAAGMSIQDRAKRLAGRFGPLVGADGKLVAAILCS